MLELNRKADEEKKHDFFFFLKRRMRSPSILFCTIFHFDKTQADDTRVNLQAQNAQLRSGRMPKSTSTRGIKAGWLREHLPKL